MKKLLLVICLTMLATMTVKAQEVTIPNQETTNIKSYTGINYNRQDSEQAGIQKIVNVTVFGENGDKQVLKSGEKNYYRATDIFGDTGNAEKNQPYIPSALNEMTKATVGYAENVVVNVRGCFTKGNNTARDLRMADIFAKQVGKWSNGEKEVSGCFAFEKTDAYEFALSVNADDYKTGQTEFRGKSEEHKYFNPEKSDNKITLFSTEITDDGNEYLAMRDRDGNVHYFDKSNNLSKVTDSATLKKLQQRPTSAPEQ